jgi:hypothetical protein
MIDSQSSKGVGSVWGNNSGVDALRMLVPSEGNGISAKQTVAPAC